MGNRDRVCPARRRSCWHVARARQRAAQRGRSIRRRSLRAENVLRDFLGSLEGMLLIAVLLTLMDAGINLLRDLPGWLYRHGRPWTAFHARAPYVNDGALQRRAPLPSHPLLTPTRRTSCSPTPLSHAFQVGGLLRYLAARQSGTMSPGLEAEIMQLPPGLLAWANALNADQATDLLSRPRQWLSAELAHWQAAGEELLKRQSGIATPTSAPFPSTPATEDGSETADGLPSLNLGHPPDFAPSRAG